MSWSWIKFFLWFIWGFLNNPGDSGFVIEFGSSVKHQLATLQSELTLSQCDGWGSKWLFCFIWVPQPGKCSSCGADSRGARTSLGQQRLEGKGADGSGWWQSQISNFNLLPQACRGLKWLVLCLTRLRQAEGANLPHVKKIVTSWV